MIEIPAERRRPDGSFVYPHRILDGAQAPEAVSLLRQTLAEAKGWQRRDRAGGLQHKSGPPAGDHGLMRPVRMMEQLLSARKSACFP